MLFSSGLTLNKELSDHNNNNNNNNNSYFTNALNMQESPNNWRYGYKLIKGYATEVMKGDYWPSARHNFSRKVKQHNNSGVKKI